VTAVTRARIIVALAFGLAAALATGCSTPLPSTSLPPARLVAPALEFPNLRDYRGVVDCRYRAGGLDEGGVAELAKAAQIDFITDGDPYKPGAANYGIGGFTSQVLFIPGATFEAGGGEIVAVNATQPIDPGKSPVDIVNAIHDQGGLAIAASPAKFKSPDSYALADGVEIFNQRAAWMEQSPSALYMRAIFFGTDHFLLDLGPPSPANLAIYDRMASGSRITLLAGMGAPDNMTVMGSKVGAYDQLFLFYTTHLLAPERNTAPLVDALRHGHAYVSFDVLGYVGQFAFYAQNGADKTMMGDEVRLAPGLTLKAELPDNADRIVMLENGGEVAAAENADHLAFVPKSPGAYRVEALRRGYPWIMSNPMYVR
jgi:hypothetical protein